MSFKPLADYLAFFNLKVHLLTRDADGGRSLVEHSKKIPSTDQSKKCGILSSKRSYMQITKLSEPVPWNWWGFTFSMGPCLFNVQSRTFAWGIHVEEDFAPREATRGSSPFAKFYWILTCVETTYMDFFVNSPSFKIGKSCFRVKRPHTWEFKSYCIFKSLRLWSF